MEKQYNVTWVQPKQMPPIGVECPKCGDGTLEDSQYGGVWCRVCKWKWKESKYPPKGKGQSGGTERILDDIDREDKILKECADLKNGIRIINENIENIAEGIEKLLKKDIPTIEEDDEVKQIPF